MSRASRRSALIPGYVLGSKPWRDTSRILEVFSREYGRLGVFARGVRGPASKLSSLLQPFRPLLLSVSPGAEAHWLSGCEADGYVPELPPAALMSGFYLNELLVKLTVREDPHPQLFDAYSEALNALRAAEPPHRPLRLFEMRLLQEIGYGLDLESDSLGQPVQSEGHYRFRAGEGLLPVAREEAGALPGNALLSLAAGLLAGEDELLCARRLLAAALDHCLEGRPIATRAVALACRPAAGRVSKEET